ncbi:MAG TPA: DoxX family protein [Proteobacteria bacterium]|nr:DoxX family protein [Pseudomonadota bacterium]
MLDKIFGSNNAWGPFILRMALGAFSIIHGTQKLFGAFDGSGLQSFSGMCAGMGLKPPDIWAIAIAIIQFLGGIFLVFGIITRLSALVIGIIIVVMIAGGVILIDIEYQIVLVAACISLIFTGGGRAALRD